MWPMVDADASAHPRPAPDHAGVRVPPPLIHGGAVVAGLGLGVWWPLALPGGPAVRLAGGLLMLAALVLTALAFREFRRHGNPVAPHRPVQCLQCDGPYRYTRNPLYLALAGLHAGLGLLLANGWLLVTLVPAVAVVRYFVIAREEAYLRRRFGAAYLDYCRRVRRWL